MKSFRFLILIILVIDGRINRLVDITPVSDDDNRNLGRTKIFKLKMIVGY